MNLLNKCWETTNQAQFQEQKERRKKVINFMPSPLKEETFAGRNFRGGADREIFAFRGKKLSRSNDFRIFRGKKLSRIVDFREFGQIYFYGVFNNQVREKDRVYFFV